MTTSTPPVESPAEEIRAVPARTVLFTPMQRGIALVLFLLTLTVYSLTTCRTIYTGDDGDFITAIVTTGITHPTGYPLFCLLGKLFLLLPFGEPAFRINLMTAFFGATSVGLLYLLLTLLVRERVWALLGALLYAFSATLWQQSLSCEVYTLTCCFLIGMLLLTRVWMENPQNDRLLQGMAALYGLSLTHHLMMVLFLPGFLAVVLARRKTLLREWKVLGGLVAIFLTPLLLYGYLYLAARFGNSPVKWGNPSTLPALFDHISGRQYRGLLKWDPVAMAGKSRDYLGMLNQQYGFWFLWLLLPGVIAFCRDLQVRPLAFLTVYIFAVNVLYSLAYQIFDIYVYYLPSYIIAAIWLTVGACAVWEFLLRRFRLDADRQSHLLRLITPIVVTIGIVQMSLHYAENDKSGNRIESEFAANILRSAPAEAIIIVRHNVAFTLWYRQFVLRERPDVVVISAALFSVRRTGNYWYYDHVYSRYPDVEAAFPPGMHRHPYANTTVALLRLINQALKKEKPVLLCLALTTRTEDDRVFTDYIKTRLARVPWGITERLYPPGKAPDATLLYRQGLTLWEDDYLLHGVFTGGAHNDPLQAHIALTYAESCMAFARLAEQAKQYKAADSYYGLAQRLFLMPEADAARERLKPLL